MNIVLKVWRQESPAADGRFVDYPLNGPDTDIDIDTDIERGWMLLDALDALNEKLVAAGERPIAFDSDCREGICGACGLVVNGLAHGGTPRTTTCELSVRAALASSASTTNGTRVIVLEPFRTGAFPVVCDLVVDRSALDRVIMAGGFVTVRTGSAPEANMIPIPKSDAEPALDAASCIGCGACVAACPNGAAALFAGAKASHLGRTPQGKPEQSRRALALVGTLADAGFGPCSLHGECEAACPKDIRTDVIARLNADTLRARLGRR
ncbi:MAG TPA: succinate dehydrogenase/fumarate reductase iron-sulfur subunit [Kofleriaceae bacterium]|nr:succinate dehydrogenase/fumarate reductase iron-sulfur subunit [Kofleriaceae bacterium]